MGNAALLHQAEFSAAPSIAAFAPQNVVNMLWAFARCAFVAGIIAAVPPRIVNASPQQIANALWACATLRADPGPLSGANPESMGAQSIANGLWALATLVLSCANAERFSA